MLATSSVQTYKRAWALYVEFAAIFGIMNGDYISIPLSVGDLSLFVAYLDSKELAPATLCTYMSALGFQHKLLGMPDPTTSFVIQKLLQSVKYNRQSEDARLPITEALLIKISQCAELTIENSYNRLMFRSMISLAFWVFFRIGELTSGGDSAIKVKDVFFTVENNIFTKVTVILHTYKHNRGGRPFHVVMHASQHELICPVRLLTAFLQARHTHSDTLLIFQEGHTVSRHWFAKQLNTAIRFCGLDSERYKCHSFRIGAATWAAEHGHTDAQIRYLGRWQSDAFRKYIRPSGL